MGRAAFLLTTTLLAAPGAAESLLRLPDSAEAALNERELAGRYVVPTGPWSGAGMPAFEASGVLTREVWQIADFTAGTGVLLTVLTDQLTEAGFEPLFSCTTQVCGGFDFRFALDVAPEPIMHVNLADFGYYAAWRDAGEGASDYAILLVSEGGGIGFVQSVHVAPEGAEIAEVTLSSRSPEQAAEGASVAGPGLPGDLAGALSTIGRAPLPGITFEYGSTQISDTDAPVLGELAQFLDTNPEIRLTLVGHTDAEGSLSSNISVSRARAAAVRDALITQFGIAPNRLSADGVGFLMPLAPNTTQEGRDINRRVEAVVINTE